MADPLSITLAAISLATALKDIIELAQKIEESLKKSAQNMGNLYSLSTEISATLRELKEFCEEHHTVLSDAKDMKTALLELMLDMKSVYTKCRQMVPPTPEKKIAKIKIVFSGWKNRDRIESEIMELRNRVNKCHSRFMMFTVMRIERRLVDMGRKNSLKHLVSHEEKCDKPGHSKTALVAFVGSGERLPQEITADFISDTYLRLQVEAIDVHLQELSSRNFYPVEPPLEDYLRPYQPVVHMEPLTNRNTFRQDIIAQALEIQLYLRSDSSTLSIQEGAWSMVNLSIGLHSLEMYEEAASMGLWTVNLFRTLVNTNAPVYSPYLVHALRLLSRFYLKINDTDKAKVAIDEAILIGRRLQSPFAEPEIRFQLGEALITLAYVSDLKGDYEASLKAAQEGVYLYEEVVIKSHVRNHSSFSDVTNAITSTLQTTYHWLPALERFSDKAICDYSRALDQLSFSLQNMAQLEASFNSAAKALDILLHSRPTVCHSTYNQVSTASLLYRLSHQQFHTVTTLDQALMYAQQSVDRYRSLCENNMDQNILYLCEALYEYANILGKMERYDEALVVWKETAEMAKNMIDNQVLLADALNELSWSYRKLERHSEAATIRTESVTVYQTSLDSTSDKAAHGYYNLGVDLRLAGQFSEAIEALHMSLTRYRALAFNDPELYNKNIGNTLNQLTLNLIHSGRHDEAFNDGYESLKLHNIMIDKNPATLSEYRFALLLNCYLAEVAENEGKCIERANHNLLSARDLAKRFPREDCNMLLTQTIVSQSVVLCRFERLSEGWTAIQESVRWFECNPCQNSKEAEHNVQCRITTSSIGYTMGYVRVPLEHLDQSIEIGKRYPSDPIISDLVVGSMQRRAELLGIMGRYTEAVDASLVCEMLARRLDTKIGIVNFVSSLRVCSMAFRDIGELPKAIRYIEEALKLCYGVELSNAAKTKSYAYVFASECLCTLSDCLADMGQEPEAFVNAKKSLDAALALKGKHPTLPWSEIEPSYIDALHTLSMRLASNDDLSQAITAIVEVRDYYEKRVKCRNGSSLSLARSLRLESVLCCGAGRHEEGIVASAKLQELQDRLSVALPEHAELTGLQLSKDETYPSRVALLIKLDLRCGHQ